MILRVLETWRQVLDAWTPILVVWRLVLEAWTPILESRGLFLGAWRPQNWIYGGLRTDKLEKLNILKYIRKPQENKRFSRVWSRVDLKLVLGACLDVDFEWFGAWRLLAGGRWVDLGDLEL